jgi:hypothetical protein
LSDVFMKLGASKLPQKGATPPAKRRLSYDGVHFFRRARIPGKSSQKRHLSGRVLSQVADADANQAHGDSLYVRALQALLDRGEDPSPDRRSARRDAFDGS